MNVAVEISKIVAAMTDHRPRECGHRFRRNFDWAGNEEFVVRNHGSIIRRFDRFAQTFLIFDEADVAAALDVAFLDVFQIFGAGVEAHVFFHIMF